MARAALSSMALEQMAITAHYNSKELAALCQLSARHLQREFRRQLNQTPQKWLDELRIKAAAQLLLGGMPVKRVAIELGFKQISHFCRQFKLRNRQTPSEFASSQFQLLSNERNQHES